MRIEDKAIDATTDTLSIEEIRNRIKYLRLAEHFDPEVDWDEALTEAEREELVALRDIVKEVETYNSSPSELIHEDHFQDYARGQSAPPTLGT